MKNLKTRDHKDDGVNVWLHIKKNNKIQYMQTH